MGLDSYSLSRLKFEEMITPFIDSSCTLCEQLVQQSRIKWESINRVLLVGGSCRIPLVQKRLEQQFNRPVVAIDDPELAICFGAAIYGVNLEEIRIKETESKGKEREQQEIQKAWENREQEEKERQQREPEKESDEEWWQKYETDIDQYESPDEDDEEWWQKYETDIDQYESPDENDEEWWQKYEIDIDQDEYSDKHKQPVTIYVGNLYNELTAEDIKEVFSEYGHVEQVDLKRGYAFVKMANLTESLNAINALDGAEWMGRDLKVEKAKSDH